MDVKKFILLFAVFFSFGFVYAQPCAFRLTGHVHSTATHENLSNATVTLVEKNKVVVTDSKGDFRFDSLCAGTYTLQISHTSFQNEAKTVTLTRNFHVDADLQPAQSTLEEITITGVRSAPANGTKQELTRQQMEETKGQSLAEALTKLTGVSMLQTGSSISKPVIHGLHSNRILTINNGVRQEGQQWGNEHAPEIDPFIANKLSVIKGVDVLRYGSDAIGGVILVEPKALRTSPGSNAEINTVYAANNQQYVASAIFEQQLKALPSFTYRVQGTLKKGGNITTPGYRLNNTALEEKNFSVTGGWQREHFNTELYYSFFKTRVGIFKGAHIGNLTDLLAAIASDKPDPTFTGQQSYAIERPSQDVMHQLLKWKTGFDISGHKFNILLSTQYNQRKEFDLVRSASSNAPQINLSIITASEEINWERPKKNQHNGTIGLVAMQQDNSYTGRYLIPNFNAYAFGGYAIEKWTKGALDIQGGIRLDHKQIATSRLQGASQTFTAYHFDFTTVAASLHAGYKIVTQWKLTGSIARSTRAPHVNELLTNGIHHGSGTYEVGNIYLKPEKGWNLQLNNNYVSTNKVLLLNLTLYHNSIQNFIYRQPKPGEPVLTIRGAFPKIEYEATDAVLKGMDATATIQPLDNIHFTSQYAVLRARNKAKNTWLIGMPSDRLTNRITYSLQQGKRLSNTYFTAEVQHVGQQKRIPPDTDEKQDYKLPPAAYTLFNADASTTFTAGSSLFTLGISGRNLLNTSYREYLNAFRYFTDEMGRNISVRLTIIL